MLQEHAWFCSSKFSELTDFTLAVKCPVNVESLRKRFSVYHILMVHGLQVKIETILFICFWIWAICLAISSDCISLCYLVYTTIYIIGCVVFWDEKGCHHCFPNFIILTLCHKRIYIRVSCLCIVILNGAGKRFFLTSFLWCAD